LRAYADAVRRFRPDPIPTTIFEIDRTGGVPALGSTIET
jgi:hypothetical protein